MKKFMYDMIDIENNMKFGSLIEKELLMKKYPEEIFIVPNENILNVPLYHQEVKPGENHFQHVLKFSEKHNLNINLEQLSPELQAVGLGHIVIEIDRKYEKQCIVYLPEYLSKNQKKFINNFWIRRLFNSFNLNGFFAFTVIDSDLKMVDISPYISNEIMDYKTMIEFITNFSNTQKENNGKGKL